MQTFDATIDFTDRLALVAAIAGALSASKDAAGDGEQAFTVVVRATGPNAEAGLGEVYVGGENIPALDDADWCVTTRFISIACDRLEAML